MIDKDKFERQAKEVFDNEVKPQIDRAKMSAVEWLVEQLHRGKELSTIIRQAKEIEKEQQQELLIWRESMFTKDAPIEYILSEFNKLKNK
jgi:hypothetical protein